MPLLALRLLRPARTKVGELWELSASARLCATVPDWQTFAIISEMIMRPAGFATAPAIDLTGMTLLKIAKLAVLQGLGDGLQNWTKQLGQRACQRRSMRR